VGHAGGIRMRGVVMMMMVVMLVVVIMFIPNGPSCGSAGLGPSCRYRPSGGTGRGGGAGPASAPVAEGGRARITTLLLPPYVYTMPAHRQDDRAVIAMLRKVSRGGKGGIRCREAGARREEMRGHGGRGVAW
jgi:hypothetical protein